MSKKRIERRIPFQVAAHRLKNRLDASTGEIALWVAGFVAGAKLNAFTSELDDATQFDFQSGIYRSDPDWLDYGKKLSCCYFDERAVEEIAPAERFVGMQEAIAYLQKVTGGMPDAAGFIRSRIKNDGLPCLHPIAGVPDLDNELEFDGTLLPQAALENSVRAYFELSLDEAARVSPLSSGSRQHRSNLLRGRVAWRRLLIENIAAIDEQNGGKASVHQVLRWLREHGGDRIRNEGGADVLVWRDDNRTHRRAQKSTVMNAISEARRLLRDHE